MNQSVDNLLSVADTSAVLRIGKTKVFELIKTGHLDVIRFGRRCTRVKRSSIDRLISGDSKQK